MSGVRTRPLLSPYSHTPHEKTTSKRWVRSLGSSPRPTLCGPVLIAKTQLRVRFTGLMLLSYREPFLHNHCTPLPIVLGADAWRLNLNYRNMPLFAQRRVFPNRCLLRTEQPCCSLSLLAGAHLAEQRMCSGRVSRFLCRPRTCIVVQPCFFG